MGIQSRAVKSNSYFQFSRSYKLRKKKLKHSLILAMEQRKKLKVQETYEPAVNRENTRRSPSLMSSKTLQPSHVTLGFWTESDWMLFWDMFGFGPYCYSLWLEFSAMEHWSSSNWFVRTFQKRHKTQRIRISGFSFLTVGRFKAS
jgi:hypothetical protein